MGQSMRFLAEAIGRETTARTDGSCEATPVLLRLQFHALNSRQLALSSKEKIRSE